MASITLVMPGGASLAEFILDSETCAKNKAGRRVYDVKEAAWNNLFHAALAYEKVYVE